MTKELKPKKKEGNFSLFSNLNPNVDKATQTVSKKKLIRGILHSQGIRERVKVYDPIEHLDSNVELLIAKLKKEKVSQEIITAVKLQAQK